MPESTTDKANGKAVVSNVHNLQLTRPNDLLVQQLEKKLEQAKSGEITGLIDVTVGHDGKISTGWVLTPPMPMAALIGSMDLLKTEMLLETMESYDPGD